MTAARVPDLHPRTPVVVGVGVVTRSGDEPGDGLEALELMLTATRTAAADAGSDAVLPALDRIAVPGGNWRYSDPARLIAERVGAPGATTSLVQVGIPQQTLFDDVYLAVRGGTVDVGLIVGGEAMRRATTARRAGFEASETEQVGVVPDDHQVPASEIITRLEIDGGMASAMAPFAMIDSALRAAEGRSIDQQRDEIAQLYAGFSAVAATNPHAAFPTPRDSAFLREPSERNRPFAFPYNKWHCAQMHVDQAAAILVCSVDAARRLGIDPERFVFPLVALESSLSVPVSERADLHRWPAMEVLGAAAEARLGYRLAEIEPVEVYSCFPAAVRVQQRALGLRTDRVPTITGGEAFAGGPWNNFVLQTTAAMVERVRTTPGEPGLVTALSGLMNKPGLTVFSTAAGPEPLLVGDLAEPAAAVTARRAVVADHQGPATVAAYTVLYDGMDPARTAVIADTPAGERCIAHCADAELAQRATREELVGQTIGVLGPTFVA
jgi:acetyl-CoA C-acetyltransferase